METEFDEIQLASMLIDLTPLQRVAFSLFCCERLYPNYVYFSKKFNWGDSTVLRDALDQMWKYLEGDDVSDRVDELTAKCNEITPNTEDFDSIYVSSALDSASTTILLLQLVKDDKVDTVVEIASLCNDTVDMYVQELDDMPPNDSELDNKILEHPFMQREIEQQRKDIELLNKANLSDTAELEILKIKKIKLEKSNIDLS